MTDKRLSLVEKEFNYFWERSKKGLPTKWEMTSEIEESGEIRSDPELNKEFHEFKKSLLDREDFSPSKTEIIDNSLTDKEVENYKALICSIKYAEGITLKNGKRIYPDREVTFYKERALIAIELLRCNEADLEDYNDISNYHMTEFLLRGAWRNIAAMFLKEIAI